MLILGNDLLLIMWSCCLVPWCMKHTIINNWNYLAGIPMSRSDQTAPAWTGNVEFAFVDVFVDVSVVKVNVYNAQTFSFTLVTLLYSLTIVLAYCTHIYYRDLTNIETYFYCSVNYHRAGLSITNSKPSVGIYDPNIFGPSSRTCSSSIEDRSSKSALHSTLAYL